MFKKTFAIIALIGLAFTTTVSTASARSQGYKADNHKQGGYKAKNHKQGGYKNKSQGKFYYNKGKHQKFKVNVRYGVPIHRIRNKLRHRGFYKIRFTDRYLPVYKARACKHGKRFKMRINRWGEVMRRRQIGWCGYRNRHYSRYNY